MTLIDIPSDTDIVRMLRMRTTISDEASEIDGVLYWDSNKAVIPPWVFRDASVHCPEAQKEAYRKSLDATMARYRRAQPARPSLEEQFEMRAEFGPGETVVDIISGRRWTTSGLPPVKDETTMTTSLCNLRDEAKALGVYEDDDTDTFRFTPVGGGSEDTVIIWIGAGGVMACDGNGEWPWSGSIKSYLTERTATNNWF